MQFANGELREGEIKTDYQSLLKEVYDAMFNLEIDKIHEMRTKISFNNIKYNFLTDIEHKYIINKLIKFECYLETNIINNYNFFKALNNNYKIHHKILMYVQSHLSWMDPSPEKWKLFKHLLSFIKHNRNKFEKSEYIEIVNNIFSSVFDIYVKR